MEKVIKEYYQQFPVILLTGSRQVGKTSLLTYLFPEASYINLDNPEYALDANNSPDDFLKKLKLPVIIDEAQYAPGLFRYIKIIIDKIKLKGQFLLTGSQNFSLMQNVSESLAGRCGVINLFTLTANELYNKNKTFKIEDFIIKGGFPVLYSEQNVNYLYWFPSYVSTYLERDVRNIINVNNLRDFNRFIRILAARTGQILSLSDIARDVGISPNTIKSWISVLQASQHIYLLEPYYKNIGKRLVKSPKIYFCDTGFVAHLMGINNWEEFERSPFKGAIWETYVFNQIYKNYINKGQTNPNLWFWRTNTGNEVDFLIEKGGFFYAVESKLTSNPDKNDLKGFEELKKYYGENKIIKTILACKVNNDFKYNKDVYVSNFIDTKIID